MPIKGLDKLNARLAAIPQGVKDALQPALAQSGDELKDRIQGLAPVDTGALRDSVAVTTAGNTTPPYSQPGGSMVVPENSVVVTVGNSEVRYPHLVEYGTHDTTAQPYFWPAWRLSKSRIKNRLTRAIRKAIREHSE